ncbi:ATP-dependent DNA helicase [Trichonephila clavipes]|nr:ATP-dependent DNA helicase [Trichonephila clavipes]
MWHLTQYYELNEIMRQKDDKTYAELLNHLALGKLTDKDVELLKTKQTILEKVPKSATLLYHSNHDVDLANKIRLNSIEGPLVKSQAYDSVSGTAPNGSKQKVLDKVQKFDRTKTGNLESVIKFKVGAKYMLTYNIDTADGLVNGAVGQQKKLEYCFIKGSYNQEVKPIWLEFSNPNDIAKEKRRQCIHCTIQNKMGLLWAPIERVKKSCVPLQQRRHFSDKKSIPSHSSGSDDNPQITRSNISRSSIWI